jgi:hypothetical protein
MGFFARSVELLAAVLGLAITQRSQTLFLRRAIDWVGERGNSVWLAAEGGAFERWLGENLGL